MNLHPSIFKSYDIRGVYPSQIDEEGAYAIGRAFATMLGREEDEPMLKIAIGSDARLSSPSLKKALIDGITDTGKNVDDMGIVSTPTFYYTVAARHYHGGIQVSASHNPKDWNGFKIVRKGAVAMSLEAGLRELKSIIDGNTFAPLVERAHKGLASTIPDVVETQVKDQALVLLTKHPIRQMKAVIDTANGMGVLELKELFQRIPGLETVWMNEALDGSFPAHPADPMQDANTEDLRKRIVAERADFGIATDGDGDRVFFFDEKGNVVPQEILRAIMAAIELEEYPESTIVYDIRPGRITYDIIQEKGGKGIEAPVGHSLIKAIMMKENAVYGGESSGHHFYRFPYGTFEAPVVLIIKFLQFISRSMQPVSVQIQPYRKYYNSGEINTTLASREAGVVAIESLKKIYSDGTQQHTDGLSVGYPDYWFNVRLSNTEPLIRLIVEARTEALMREKCDEILRHVRDGSSASVQTAASSWARPRSNKKVFHWLEYLVYIGLAAGALLIMQYA